LGGVETFSETVGICKNVRYIVGAEHKIVADDLNSGVNTPKVLDHTIDLGPAELVDEVLLPVEIGLLDIIEIDDYKLADTRPGKSDSDIRAKPAESGDTDC
jgi:hypothetical protein